MRCVLLLQLAFFLCVGVALSSLIDRRCRAAETQATAVMLTHVPIKNLGDVEI